MRRRDFFLALLVVIIWGGNFTIIKLGLNDFPAMLLVALRYIFTFLPAVFFVKRPAIEWRYIIANGLSVGVGQFGCVFYAIHIGMPAGAASVVLQSQVFFTLVFSRILLREKLTGRKITGAIIAAVGLYLIGSNLDAKGSTVIPLTGFLLTLLGASFWSLSNIIVKRAANKAASQGEKLDMLGLVVWTSLVPPLPMLVLTLLMDKPQALLHAITNLNAVSIFAVFYLAVFATLFGYGTWSELLAKYPAGKVAPLSILVPVTGLLTAQIVLNEHLSTRQWLGAAVILISLVTSSLDFLIIRNTGSHKLSSSK